MDSVIDEIEKYCNIFDTVVNSIGPAALENDETRDRVLTTFETILRRLRFAVPVINSIIHMARQVIAFLRFGQQLYQLIMSIFNGNVFNGSRPLRY